MTPFLSDTKFIFRPFFFIQKKFAFYLCLRDEIQEEDEGVEDGENEEEDEEEDPNYSRLSDRRQDQSLLFELHHCDVIVLKTDNGWCFDQEIFLPAWKRDSYEVAEQDSNGFSSSSAQEFVKVDEIRLD
ncbi:hypothetical protein BY996DRAFT_4573323 [Phakopsora pachyrhizi]|nr:hypothetical protein BY996DRAFT_4573323 [Phakopsora pachyrhizi]